MSAHTLNPEELAATAREALERSVDTKVDAVRTLVEKSVAAEDAERRAASARSASDAAWNDALSTGWTDKELRQLGLTAPDGARPRAPRKRRAADSPQQA
ncbi:hypothetical protein [Microbacterium aurantiacum]|uniref:hypothetical protein n=1 Tax=Microbacterium aurantiacum TaxID=162393 RepID=UPI003F496AF6